MPVGYLFCDEKRKCGDSKWKNELTNVPMDGKLKRV